MRDSVTYGINLLPCGILGALWWSEANVGVQGWHSALTQVLLLLILLLLLLLQ